ncbi:MAG: response regulator [Acidobacteria bacterium]|nr:response regulator [Acidobacteriota bacterium]
MISVCLCDPQPVVQEGLRALLDRSEDIELIAACNDIDRAVDIVGREQPDIVILDRSFGMHSVLEALAELRARPNPARAVVWGSQISDVESFRSIQAGASGIMKKTVDPKALYHCLRTVSSGHLWTQDLYESRNDTMDRPRNRPLTPRERQVAQLVSRGLKNREIAETLGIATGTVKIHLMHIFEKTGIRDRFELALQGLRRATEMKDGASRETVWESRR